MGLVFGMGLAAWGCFASVSILDCRRKGTKKENDANMNIEAIYHRAKFNGSYLPGAFNLYTQAYENYCVPAALGTK
ncbi:hypothetical protein ACP8HI_06305 [Paenibacillus sp. FA6]|uniref:hypothetical protein n=1 Tax=Paenibacillus sp. FA6 TaxID=3413029 RepID=UPI003F65AA4F